MAEATNQFDERLGAGDPVAFPVLTTAEIDILRKYGEEKEFEDGDALWSPGDRDYCFFVILTGGCRIKDAPDRKDLIAYHSPGGFSGDVDIMTGRPAPVGGYADGPTSTLVLSAANVREAVKVEQDLGGKLLLAFFRRRELLLKSADHGALLIGSRFDPEALHIREFLVRNRIVHRWKQTEDDDVGEFLTAFGFAAAETPILFLGAERMSHPTIEQLADRLGVRRKFASTHYDLIIIGAGPAGLAAAVYGSSEGLKTLLLDKSAPGGQASWSSRIENYMGFPEGLSGSELAARGLLQAQKFGTEVNGLAEVTGLESGTDGHRVVLSSGQAIDAKCIIIASGAAYQKLDCPGYAKFEANGIYYAATKMESTLCSQEDVIVVGAGNSAGQAAVYLSQLANTVRLVVRGDNLGKSMSDYLSYRINQIHNIEVLLETQIAELDGDGRLQKAVLTGKHAGDVPCRGLFVFIGAWPNTSFLKGCVQVDKKGFVLTGDAMRAFWDEARLPYYLETSCPGVFAAGDCRQGSVKRVASSVGEGSMAVTFVHRFLAG